MITFVQKGDFRKLNNYLEKIKHVFNVSILDKYGTAGVEALRSATPVDSGETADSWYYKVERKGDRTSLGWYNSNQNEGYHIAILIQYGHGTGNGAYVQGVDYINPAIQPVFEKIAEDIWKEVTSVR